MNTQPRPAPKSKPIARTLAAAAGVLAALALTAAASGQAFEVLPPEAFERCGTQLSPDSAARMFDHFMQGTYDHVLEGSPPTIRVRLTTIRNGSGANGLTDKNMDDAAAALGDFYVSIGLHFVETASRRFINSAAYTNLTAGQFNNMLDAYNTSNTVDIYFVQSLTDASGQNANGQATFSTDASAGVVVINAATPSGGSNYSTLPHEVGHYFDLLHTHETVFGVECPNELNCIPAGDQVCDTPADPDLSGRVDSSCRASGLPGIPGFCQAPPTPYSPSTSNIMSYSTVPCRNRITGGQATRMISAADTLRSDHIYAGGSLAVSWLDFGAGSGGYGAKTAPFGSLSTALSQTQAGGRIVINPSPNPSRFTGTINQPVTLDAWHAPVDIGR